jgi:predicted DNA-binding transcriptional regulator YafY
MQGGTLTTREAAEMFDVSLRTIQRDFDAISRAVPIYRDDDGRWRHVDKPSSISEY